MRNVIQTFTPGPNDFTALVESDDRIGFIAALQRVHHAFGIHSNGGYDVHRPSGTGWLNRKGNGFSGQLWSPFQGREKLFDLFLYGRCGRVLRRSRETNAK